MPRGPRSAVEWTGDGLVDLQQPAVGEANADAQIGSPWGQQFFLVGLHIDPAQGPEGGLDALEVIREPAMRPHAAARPGPRATRGNGGSRWPNRRRGRRRRFRPWRSGRRSPRSPFPPLPRSGSGAWPRPPGHPGVSRTEGSVCAWAVPRVGWGESNRSLPFGGDHGSVAGLSSCPYGKTNPILPSADLATADARVARAGDRPGSAGGTRRAWKRSVATGVWLDPCRERRWSASWWLPLWGWPPDVWADCGVWR